MMRALKSALNFDKTKASLTIPVPLSATKKIKESIIFTVDSENIHVEINFRNIHTAGYLENHLQSIRDWISGMRFPFAPQVPPSTGKPARL